MRHIVLGSMIVAALIAASMPLMAHHSFAAEFDSNKQVKLTGTVTKIDWTNPHVWFYMDVKDESGKINKAFPKIVVPISSAARLSMPITLLYLLPT